MGVKLSILEERCIAMVQGRIVDTLLRYITDKTSGMVIKRLHSSCFAYVIQ